MKTILNQKSLIMLGSAILLTALFLLPGCKKDKNDKTDTAACYYKATIGGSSYSQTVTETNGYIAGSSLAGTDDVTVTADISPENPSLPNSTAISITKGILHNYLSLTNVQFYNYFAPGNFSYTTGPDYDPFKNGDGFIISWFDKDGQEWTTSDGSGDQTNSTIKIISVKDSQAINNYYLLVKLQFSCKLYNTNTGEMKQLTNGEFVGFFGKI
ncbi:MAG: hypothetical protein ACTHK0_08830 [Ginsengibacter sp.]